MRKIFMSTLLVLIMCAAAQADIVYTTDAGAMGLIKTYSASTDLRGTQYTTSGTNTLLGSYWDGSESRIILVNRTTDLTTSGDTALIFAPNNLTAPVDDEIKTLEGLYNAQAVNGSYNGRSLFFTSGASLYEFNTSSFAAGRSYTYKPESGDSYTPTMKGIISSQSRIYCLVDREGRYPKLLGFDGQLRDDVSKFVNVTISSDASCIAWISSARVVAGTPEGVSLWRTRGFVHMVSSDAPVTAVCQDNGDGFYFTEQTSSGDVYTTTLRHYSSESGTIATLYTNTTGKTCQLLYDDTNKLLAGIVGSKILVYRMSDDSLIAEYSSDTLGGLPVNVVLSSVSGDDGKTSSGCNAGAGGVIMLLACLFLKRR